MARTRRSLFLLITDCSVRLLDLLTCFPLWCWVLRGLLSGASHALWHIDELLLALRTYFGREDEVVVVRVVGSFPRFPQEQLLACSGSTKFSALMQDILPNR